MKQYNVTGMSCAACSARVEKAVSKVEGVTSCSVSLLTNSMGVDGNASPEAVIAAVEAAGYGASPKTDDNVTAVKGQDPLADKETPKLLARLLASVGFLLVLMYISMGHVMWGWYLPKALADNYVAIALSELLLAAIVMIINQRFFINGFKGLFKGAANMDTLVALGSGAAFVYSTAVLFIMTAEMAEGNVHEAHAHLHGLYFESAAMILTLITVGKMLEARAKGKTTSALKSLMDLAPKTATVIRNGEEATVSVDQIRKGDIFIVRPGEKIAADGIVIEGGCAVDESSLTGESIPVDKSVGDGVSAATTNRSGFIKCEATRVGEDTTLSQIIKMVSDAAATKAPIAKIADKVSGVFVPVVIAIALVATAAWLISSGDVGYALARGISVLVISCPCALGLATPVAIMVGNGVGAKKGILFKTAAALEETGRIEIVALDKTGTVTKGEPRVTDLITVERIEESDLLAVALTLESKSEHPLARAIVEFCKRREVVADVECENFRVLVGNGVEGEINGKRAVAGNLALITTLTGVSDEMKTKADELSGEGKTPVFISLDGEVIGALALADTVKADSKAAVDELRAMGVRVAMLTGDNERCAAAIGRSAGIDEVYAGVLPDGKERIIKELKKEGKVMMVGDGINDAPALTSADVGMAIGAGTDVAIDAADVVLMNSRLTDVVSAIKLSRATLRNIHQNLFWAFFYNSVGIPLAAGAFIAWLGWEMNPMFGAAAMSLSSFCVVTNALRLNFVKLPTTEATADAGGDLIDVKVENVKKYCERKESKMQKTLKIEGMMCPHCEARVKKCLEALDGVISADVSHKTDSATVTLSADVSDELLKKTVEDAGYTVK